MNVVFMGTPDFAVYSLCAVAKHHNIVGVFTQPDKLVGRKQVLTPPPVKVKALELGVPVFQPNTLRDGEALEILKKLNPDVIVVAAYGKFLPNEILNLPKYGCINVHGSLLPALRGASPIQWSIVTGEKQTGITTMLMGEGMDTGDMLEKAVVDITENDNFSTLHDKLAIVGAELIISTLKKCEDGTITPIKQDESLVTYAPIIKKEMGLIDFSKNATAIRNLVRGFDPWPSAYTFLNGKRFKIISATVVPTKHNSPCGTLLSTENEIIVACGENTSLKLDRVQLEGSKPMSDLELLRGHKLQKGLMLGE